MLSKKYNLSYHAENEVIVTTGASEAIDIAFRTILLPGAEVILPGPVYPGYEPIIKMAGAIPVYADTTENGFKMTAEIIQPYINRSYTMHCFTLPIQSNRGYINEQGTTRNSRSYSRQRYYHYC